MLINSWSIALSFCTLFAIMLGLIAVRTAIRVLRFWDVSSDSGRQIRLESEIWLSATLMEYGLGFQLLSLVLLVLAADNFSSILVGAMCATGSFTANEYGLNALLFKLAAVFFYGFWIVLHRLDISSAHYPLVRLKYGYLLFIIPILALDGFLQTMYLAKLEPDIITSCCGIIFGTDQGDSQNLLGLFPTQTLLILYYGCGILIVTAGIVLLKQMRKKETVPRLPAVLFSLLWLLFYPLSIVVITVVISSYIYAMPYHHCPFCILKWEYYSVGFPIFFALIAGSFFGLCVGLSTFLPHRDDFLAGTIHRFCRFSTHLSLWLLLFFLLICSYYPIVYNLFGGEI